MAVTLRNKKCSARVPILRSMKVNLAFVPIEEGTCPCGRSLVTKMKTFVDEEASLDEQLITEMLKR